MNEADIRKYAELMKELGLTGFELENESGKVRLERTCSVSANEVAYVNKQVKPQEQPAVAGGDYLSVTSPFVGVFYAAPAENAQPYVKVGDRVKKGQTLCIVEAMKLMNEISAEEDGVVLEICVTNGQIIEYGTELFRMKR